MEKIVVLLSGGIDSSVATAYMKSKQLRVFPLFINHQQGPLYAERKAARTIASELGVKGPLEVELDLMTLKKQSKEWLKFNIGTPGRNMVFISLAVMYSGIIGADGIALATAYGSTYPDTSFAFLEAIQRIGEFVLDRNIKVFSPFKHEKWTHSDVIKHGTDLNVPLEKTWSCFLPNRDVQCGVCDKCKDRKRRFKEAGIDDKTTYDPAGVSEEDLRDAMFFV